MVFTVSVRNLSFKQNLYSQSHLLIDQKSTYAVLKYALDIPDEIYFYAMDLLAENEFSIYDHRLARLVKKYKELHPYRVWINNEETIDEIEEFTCLGQLKIGM